MRKLILFLCCLTFIFTSVIPVYATAPKSTDDLPTQYYSFKMVYQMLLFEVSKAELILRLPAEIKFLFPFKRERLKKKTLSHGLAKAIERFATRIQGDVAEPYVVQGIDEFIDYINGSVGKSFYQIYDEITDQPIATLNKVTDDAASDELSPASDVKTFKLMGNYPNPFNPGTSIEYSLPEDSFVKLTIYNIRGQEIAILVNGNQQQGIQKVQWDGRNSRDQQVPSGEYFYKLQIDNQLNFTGKMTLIK